MKNARLFISAFAVFAVVGSALAFNAKPMNQGSVYCNSSCSSRIDFRVSTSTTNITDPCENGPGGEFVLAPGCTQITGTTTQFEAVTE